MSAHGISDPLQCNLCGVRCKDSDEFQSHLIHGHNAFQPIQSVPATPIVANAATPVETPSTPASQSLIAT